MTMRTTIDLADEVLENAKAAAFQQGVTLSEFLQEALRAYLSFASGAGSAPFQLHTVRGEMVQPGLDLDRASALVVADDESSYFRSR